MELFTPHSTQQAEPQIKHAVTNSTPNLSIDLKIATHHSSSTIERTQQRREENAAKATTSMLWKWRQSEKRVENKLPSSSSSWPTFLPPFFSFSLHRLYLDARGATQNSTTLLYRLTSMSSCSVKNGWMLSVGWSPSRCTRDRSFPPKMSLIGERPKSVVRVMVPLFRLPRITFR